MRACMHGHLMTVARHTAPKGACVPVGTATFAMTTPLRLPLCPLQGLKHVVWQLSVHEQRYSVEAESEQDEAGHDLQRAGIATLAARGCAVVGICRLLPPAACQRARSCLRVRRRALPCARERPSSHTQT